MVSGLCSFCTLLQCAHFSMKNTGLNKGMMNERPQIWFSVHNMSLIIQASAGRSHRWGGGELKGDEWMCEQNINRVSICNMFSESLRTPPRQITVCGLACIKWDIQSSQPSPWKQCPFNWLSESALVCIWGLDFFMYMHYGACAQERHERKSDSTMTQFSVCLFTAQFV